MKRSVVSFPVTILILFSLISTATSEEYSMIKDSTVLGQNFGYPSGTPRQSQTTIGDIDLVFETAVFMKNLELWWRERLRCYSARPDPNTGNRYRYHYCPPCRGSGLHPFHASRIM